MVIPISGFLPVPLPMMIPFMGAQSLVIGKMFGEGFQYGKRKISAMSNEEFNKLTFEDMMSNARTELKASIPTINASLQDMDEMVVVVVNEFLKYIGLVTKTVIDTTGTSAFAIAEAAAHAIGTHIPGAHQPVQEPTPSGPTIQQPFSPENPTPFTPRTEVCTARWKKWDSLKQNIHSQFLAVARNKQIAISQPAAKQAALKRAAFHQREMTSLSAQLDKSINTITNRDCAKRWKIPR